jgi:hypothetical protein
VVVWQAVGAKLFFSEEKNQKTFASSPLPRSGGILPPAPEIKVFCFFSSEKKTLLHYIDPALSLLGQALGERPCFL